MRTRRRTAALPWLSTAGRRRLIPAPALTMIKGGLPIPVSFAPVRALGCLDGGSCPLRQSWRDGAGPPTGRGFAARAHLECGPRVGPVRAAIPCNALRTRTESWRTIRSEFRTRPKRRCRRSRRPSICARTLRRRKPEPDPAAPSDPFAPPIAPLQPAAEREGRRRPSRSAPPIDEDLFLPETVGAARLRPGRSRRGEADAARRQ